MPRHYWWYIAAFILIVALAAIGMYVQAHAQAPGPYDCDVSILAGGAFNAHCEPQVTETPTEEPVWTETVTISAATMTATPTPLPPSSTPLPATSTIAATPLPPPATSPSVTPSPPTGPRLNRYENRRATGEPLTPWPMESRALAELGVSVNGIIREYAER